jgi:hypothetical protein
MTLIKLTGSNGEQIYLNVELCTAITTNNKGGHAEIHFDHFDDDSSWLVKGTTEEVVASINKQTKKAPLTDANEGKGLIGLFGHTYIADPNDPDKTTIQYQFKVIRRMHGERYVVQMFSFWDGSPTGVRVYAETELLGPDVKLYATEELWREGAEKHLERRRARRERPRLSIGAAP